MVDSISKAVLILSVEDGEGKDQALDPSDTTEEADGQFMLI